MRRDNPLGKIEDVLEQMEREFESNPFSPIGRSVDLDVRDDTDVLVVTADLPGFEKDDIEVTLADRTLRIEAEHESHSESESGTYIRQERSHESVSRSVRLPEPVEEDGIEASYSNGVLTITLPKQEGGDGTQIDIL